MSVLSYFGFIKSKYEIIVRLCTNLFKTLTSPPLSTFCVQTRQAIRVTKHMQLNDQFLTVQEEPLF